MKLKDIVTNALEEANVKLASAADVQPPSPPTEIDLGIKLAEEDEDEEKKRAKNLAESKEDDDQDDAEKTSAFEDAKYALKLAEALDVGLPIFLKVAQPEANKANAGPSAGTSHVNAPGGMQTFEGAHNTEQTQHPKFSPASVPAQQASSGGGKDEDRNDGNKTGIETNRSDYRDPDWTKNKESALKLLQTKIAQAGDLRAAGSVKQAAALANAAVADYEARFGKIAEVQGAPSHHTAGTATVARAAAATTNAGQKSQVESGSDAERAAEARRSEKKEGGAPGAKTAGVDFANMPVKVAQDPSSPQPQGLDGAKGSGYLLSTEPPGSKQIPGNEEMASMTKRDAKTRSTRSETTPFVAETAFSASADPGVKANLSLFRGGEKISSLQAGAARTLLKKIAAAADDPEASEEDKEKAQKVREAIEAKKKEKGEEKESNMMMGY